MVKLVLVLGDQLSKDTPALKSGSKADDVVVMAEVGDEAGYVPHHPKKIAFLFAAMRKFAETLEKDGWRVAYTKLDDAQNSNSIAGELLRRADEFGASEFIATEPGEFRLIDALNACPLKSTIIEDDSFIASHADFERWAEGRKALRMEYFYREMRRKTGLLMDGDQPAGGEWNYDQENRKPPPDAVEFSGPMQFQTDEPTRNILTLVQDQFGENFGELRPFWMATDTGQARQHLAHWVKRGLPQFGDYQDAMMRDEAYMYHGYVGAYLNAGLLAPLEVCQAAEDAYRAGEAPLNAVEGFIRQILGWREYIRGIYYLEGRDYTQRNILKHKRDLPAMYWGKNTWMACMEQSIGQTEEEGYAHHIQRLMVTGNFALLAGIDPHQVHEWYLSVYVDAYEWVEAPNVIGMSQFADGGVIASKPYISSGNYINRMSNYCKDCSYKVRDKTGPDACPFNVLYWSFLDRHRDHFSGNPRMGQMYATWDRMKEERRQTILSDADAFLKKMDAGELV